MTPHHFHDSNNMRLRGQAGSATLEYVIVSTFAAVLSIASITFVGRMVKTKVDQVATKVGITADEFDFTFLDP